MRKLLFLIILICTGYFATAQDARSICVRINQLNNNVRDNRISKLAAKDQFINLMAELNKAIKYNTADLQWVFPLQSYKATAIGGVHGNGYSDKGYNYFDGNKHLAHPAHDIFIVDRDQDGIDDKTKLPVGVVSVADGIIIACSDDWDQHSTLRGGCYIWVYHPQLKMISYYAHNRKLFISPGDEVKKGQKIAEVGRTGYNAFKKRSPTHLHFGTYRLLTGIPLPFNSYNELIKAKTK